MPGAQWKAGAAALAAALLLVGSASAQLSDDQRREAILMGVAVEDDDDLRIDRAVCDRGEMLATRQRIEQGGTPFPEPHVYCRAVLREEARRRRLPSYRHRLDYEGIQQAVLAGSGTYLDHQQVRQSLLCETAYDAGYQAGTMATDREFQPQLVVDAEANARDCFSAASLNAALGFIAGVHHGQEDQRQLDHPS